MRNKLALFLTILSFFLLYPGVTFPMFILKLDGAFHSSLANMDINVLNEVRSVMQTVETLYNSGDLLVAGLIFFFSVVVPVLKGLLLFSLLTLKNSSLKPKIFSFMKRIGKWSMADVFVVAIFLAYLSTKGQLNEAFHTANLMGMTFKFKSLIALNSSLGPGFYYFLAYCLTSLLALELYHVKDESL